MNSSSSLSVEERETALKFWRRRKAGIAASVEDKETHERLKSNDEFIAMLTRDGAPRFFAAVKGLFTAAVPALLDGLTGNAQILGFILAISFLPLILWGLAIWEEKSISADFAVPAPMVLIENMTLGFIFMLLWAAFVTILPLMAGDEFETWPTLYFICWAAGFLAIGKIIRLLFRKKIRHWAETGNWADA